MISRMTYKTMNNESKIEQIVMRRVHRMRMLRFVFSGFTAGCLLSVATLYGIGREVWVARVFTNGPQDVVGHSFYLVYAFEHTRFIVQSLTLITIASLLYLAREAARLIATIFAPLRA